MRAEDRYDSLLVWAWEAMAARYAIDPFVDWRLGKAQVRAESNFRPEAVSPAGARGLLQLMPGTWGEGFERDAFNPEKNLLRGFDHLGVCWTTFARERDLERWKFALAAYNAGVGTIVKAQDVAGRRGRATDQWLEVALALPEISGERNAKETTGYVRAIISEFLAGRPEGGTA